MKRLSRLPKPLMPKESRRGAKTRCRRVAHLDLGMPARAQDSNQCARCRHLIAYLGTQSQLKGWWWWGNLLPPFLRLCLRLSEFTDRIRPQRRLLSPAALSRLMNISLMPFEPEWFPRIRVILIGQGWEVLGVVMDGP